MIIGGVGAGLLLRRSWRARPGEGGAMTALGWAVIAAWYSLVHLAGSELVLLQLDHPRMKDAIRKIVDACRKHGKLARGSAETEAQIEEYWKLGCQVLNLPGTDTSTYLDGLKVRAGRAHARLKSIGVPTP